MKYIASLSYGKDSCAMLEVIKQHDMPLDRIVHVEIMATDTIPADLPPMMQFKEKADKIIKARYGIEVEHLRSKETYEKWFYHKYGEKSKRAGYIWGFPCINANWCNGKLKMPLIKKIQRGNIAYIGIAADEPNRFHNLSERQISPLVEHGITESEARKICEELDLLSPIYTQSTRGGCWFCHNQSIGQLRLLRKQYPAYWDLMLKWDSDSPITFKPDGKTIHFYDERFALEDLQQTLFDGGAV